MVSPPCQTLTCTVQGSLALHGQGLNVHKADGHICIEDPAVLLSLAMPARVMTHKNTNGWSGEVDEKVLMMKTASLTIKLKKPKVYVLECARAPNATFNFKF